MRAQNKLEISKCFTYWGGDRKICNGHRKSFQKRAITLKNAWLPLHLCYEMKVASPFNMWLVSGCEKRYLDCILAEPEEVWLGPNSNVATILLLKTYQKWFLCYHLPCSFKIFKNSVKKYRSSFFHKNAEFQHFC